MDEILFLAHRIPYPPNKGDKIRSYNILKYLSARYRVHLGCFIDDGEDWQHVPALKGLCEETHFASLGKMRILLRAAGGLIGGRPLSLASYDDNAMRAWVNSLVNRRRIKCVYVFSSAMAQFLDDVDLRAVRTVIDFVDVDSDKWRSLSKRSSWPLRSLYCREADRLLGHDHGAAKRFDASLFVSEREAALFRSMAPDVESKIHVIRNGLDAVFFSPKIHHSNPFAGKSSVVFCGAMNYWPNEDAAVWYAKDVHPLLRQSLPSIEFDIVGRSPSRRVLNLRQRAGVNVIGTVPDVRPYLAHAAVIVVPLRDSPGVANKVLEGMAMGRPVVATPQAVSGLALQDGKEVIVADGPQELAAAVLNAVNEKTMAAELGANARARVLADFEWKSAVAGLPRLIEGS